MGILGLIGGWITHWLIGWGGVGALASVILWGLWFLCPRFAILEKVLPYKEQLLHGAVIVTFLTFGSTYFYTRGYKDSATIVNAAWDAANIKAAEDARARDEAVARAAEERVAQATTELQQQADALQKQVDEYAAQLAQPEQTVQLPPSKPNTRRDPCILTDDDIKRLRQFK